MSLDQQPTHTGDEQRLALVLSGGGASGIVQVPFLEELIRRGIRPDLIVGSSVGAVNGAFLAFHPQGIEGLAELWMALRSTRLWHRNVLRIGRNLLTRGSSLYSNRFLRDLVKQHVTIDEVAAAEIPLFIVTTSLSSGRKRIVSSGELLAAVMASIAVPGLFPPVRLGGDWCVDGGLSTWKRRCSRAQPIRWPLTWACSRRPTAREVWSTCWPARWRSRCRNEPSPRSISSDRSCLP